MNTRICIVASLCTALVATGARAGEGAQTRSYEKTISVTATPQRAWDAFTTGQGIEHWFALSARVTPGVGGTVFISWLNEYAFESPIAIWKPNEHVRILWDESGLAIEPGSFGYDVFITPRGDQTQIKLVQFGFPLTPAGDEMFKQISRGWDFELEILRMALNDHANEQRQVVYSRALLQDISLEDAWERAFGAGALIDGAPIARANHGDHFNTTFGTISLVGTVRSCTPSEELIVDLESLGGAVLRITTEPCIVAEGNVLTFWIDMWGQDPTLASEINRLAQDRLANIYGNDRLLPPLADTQ